MPTTKPWRIYTRKRGNLTWDVGLTPMTKSQAFRAVARFNEDYPDYEHKAVMHRAKRPEAYAARRS